MSAPAEPRPEPTENHWEHVYATRSVEEVSWYQAVPEPSLRLVLEACGGSGSVVDVGAGASVLVDALLAAGCSDVTVLDVSRGALDRVRERLGEAPAQVTFVHADLLSWEPARTFDVWHDRAVFHFLTTPESRARYARTVQAAVPSGGSVILAAFAPDGPASCSGLTVCRYDAPGLHAELGSAFDLVRSERADHTTPGGGRQPFTWVVLRRR